ncbi:MAG: aor 7 [Thermomicrobiales bacterium]|nr:aor 7 [Thermomicrobiales bacterium]
MEQFGYHGKVLHVDLGGRSFTVEEPDEIFWRVYGGGGLLAAAYLLQHTPAGIDAFDPANLFILTSSVVAGHPYAGLARFTAAAKSPLSGGIGEARAEGPFGIALKGSGFDSLIIHGATTVPSMLLIDDGVPSLIAAEDLWGRTVPEAVDRLEDRFGEEIHTAVIGPAGENLVRFASIVSDRHHQAARTGLGAVMGSKRLKAVVIRGDRHPQVADPDRCRAITESYAARMMDNPLTRWQLDPPGFSAWIHTHGTDTALCTHNYRDSVFPAADAYIPERFMERYRGVAPCPGCPNNCIKIFGSARHGAQDGRSGGIHQEITGAFGSNLGIADLDDVFAANILCNEFGLDPNSLGFTLSMAMECVQEGVLDEAVVGEALRFGNGDAALAMTKRIAEREGFGSVLAEGVKRAAEQIGGGAERFALHVKGVEMVPFEPRTQTNLALGYATAPIGPRYEICEHDWDYDTKVGWPHAMEGSRTLGILQRIPMGYLGPGKVRNYKALNDIWSGADALDLSLFAVAPTRILRLDEMAELLAAVTGWETSGYEIMRFGERRNHLMRVYNLREGLTAADDTLPDRFFDDPISEGTWAGTRLDRQRFFEAIRTYYQMMGWDEDGCPRPATLIDHHLEWTMGSARAAV